MTKLHKSTVLKMSLIQPLKFRTLEKGFFKMAHLQVPHWQMAVFQMGATVASGLCPKPYELL